MPYPKRPIPEIEEIAQKYLEGKSLSELSRIYPYKGGQISARLIDFGVRLRNLSEAQSIWQKGKPKSKSMRIKLSILKTGKPAPKPIDFGKHLSKIMTGKVGNNHPGYKRSYDTKTSIRWAIRSWKPFKEWKNSILLRDNFSCQECGSEDNLHIHHRKRVYSILEENNIETRKQAYECKELWDIDNGVTLCNSCHQKVEIKEYGHWQNNPSRRHVSGASKTKN